MKSAFKPILAGFGLSAAIVVGQETPLPALPISPEVNSLPEPDLGPGVPPDIPRVPEGPPWEPVPEIPAPVEIPRTVNAGQKDRKWKVIPFAGFEISATDNLFISATKRRSDFFAILSPGLAAGWGDYDGEVRQLGSYTRHFEPLEIDFEDTPRTFIFGKYNANAFFFAKNTDQNIVDHDALIAGRWEGAKLTVGGRFYFQTLSDRDIEVGTRARRKVYGGEITSNYAFGGKTSVDLNFYNRSYDYAQQLDWQEWMAEGWLNYQAMPKTKVAFGTRLGLARVQSSPTQTFEQMLARVAYLPKAKVSFAVDGGLEWRQFGSGGGSEVFGVFNVSATYAPSDGTQIALQAYRRNSAAVVETNESVTSTGVSARVQQRFFQRYFVAVEAGYESSTYRVRRADGGSDREDGTTYVKASLNFDVTKYLSAEAAYEHRENDSSRADLSFTENVVSVLFKLRL